MDRMFQAQVSCAATRSKATRLTTMFTDARHLREQAERCSRLANEYFDERTAGSLRELAREYSTKAAEAEDGERAERPILRAVQA